MIDLEFIRCNRDEVIGALEKKRVRPQVFDGVVTRAMAPAEFVDQILVLDDKRREMVGRIEGLREERNRLSGSVGKAKGDEKQTLIARSKDVKRELGELEPQLQGIEKDLNDLLLRVPNVPSDDTPTGDSDADNVEIRRWGEPPKFDFEPKDHVELGELLDIIDIPRGTKIAGSRTYYLKNEGALLELAICRFTLDHLVKKGFTPFLVPLLVRDLAMVGTGFFPGGEEQAYRIERDSLNLIGTSEVSLASYHADEVLELGSLPRLYAGFSACFRREAGTYGKDTHGIYRVHQFHKVEQVVICENDADVSRRLHNFILGSSEEVLQALGLPHRVVAVCTAEMGQGQVYKNDVETWMPSRKGYGETHSCSTLHEFQARRLNIRYRDRQGKMRFAHTLNDTAIASPRVLIPILECNQQSDGSVVIPSALRPYMAGQERITPRVKVG